jgi:hypothetical protein
MRRFFVHCLCSLLVLASFLICSVRAAPPSQDETETHRYPVFAYLVAGFCTLVILVIAGLPSRKES